jgi:hypothetical protein
LPINANLHLIQAQFVYFSLHFAGDDESTSHIAGFFVKIIHPYDSILTGLAAILQQSSLETA